MKETLGQIYFTCSKDVL